MRCCEGREAVAKGGRKGEALSQEGEGDVGEALRKSDYAAARLIRPTLKLH